MEGEKAEAGGESGSGGRAGGKKAQARQALSIYLNLPTLDEAVNTLKPWWPGLFDGDTPASGLRYPGRVTGRRGAAEYPALA